METGSKPLPELSQLLNAGYAVKAHTFSLAAEDSFNSSNYEEASIRHGRAYSCFSKVGQSASADDLDINTKNALLLLAGFHKTKAREMRRRARISSESKRGKISGVENVDIPSQPQVGGHSSKTNSIVVSDASKKSLKPAQAYQEVQLKFDEMRDGVIENLHQLSVTTDKEEHSEVVGSDDLSSRSIQTETGGRSASSNENSSFFFVPRSFVQRPPSGILSTEEGTRQESMQLIQLLREKIVVLTKENASLSKEVSRFQRNTDALHRQQLQIEEFKKEYRAKFEMLKLAMQHFQQVYAHGDQDGRRILLEARLREAVQKVKTLMKCGEIERERRKQLEQQVRSLQANVESLNQQLAAKGKS